MGAKVVLVSFDMDAQTKPGVAAALAACVKELIRLKYEVRLETWDPRTARASTTCSPPASSRWS